MNVNLVKNALEKCMNNIDMISKRNDKVMEIIFSAFVMFSIAIGLVDNSSPASEAEHHLSQHDT